MKDVIVTLTGPTCAGKSSLESALFAAGFGKAVSHTTRAPRQGEVNGVDYHFVDNATFDRMANEEGQFIEFAKYGKHSYGTSIATFTEATKRSGVMVVVVEPDGAGQIRMFCDEHNIGCLTVWVDCPEAEQARRFVQRVRKMDDARATERLAMMLTHEQGWKRSANHGIVNGYAFRYDMELREAGPDMEELYVEWISGRALSIRQGK